MIFHIVLKLLCLFFFKYTYRNKKRIWDTNYVEIFSIPMIGDDDDKTEKYFYGKGENGIVHLKLRWHVRLFMFLKKDNSRDEIFYNIDSNIERKLKNNKIPIKAKLTIDPNVTIDRINKNFALITIYVPKKQLPKVKLIL